MTRRSISNSFTVNTVEDGESAPFYNDEWYAWSNDESTASVTTAPTIAGEWSHTIPSQGSYAYLWKKVVRYDWQNSARTYVEGAAQYFRMSGTNGTSINVKGTIEYAYNSRSGFPTPSSSITGYRAVAKEDNRIWICQQVAQDAYDWVPYGGTASDGFSYTIVQGNFNGNYQSTSNLTGHLVMWSDEASDWVDLGRFKGENGVTYYTHIAWATSVGYDNQGNVTRVTGFVTVKLASDTTHIWMGVLIDTNAGQDSSNKLLYTWSNTKGNKGDKGDKGDIGRFFYFGGVWEEIESTDTFVLNDAQAPYFEHTDNGQKKYHVYNPENSPSGGTITKAVMAQTSFSNAPWEAMTNDFKYIITEALFSSYAHLGSWIFNGDYMISEKDKSGNPRGQREYNGMPSNEQVTTGFIPSIAFDAANGRASFCGDWARFNPDGSGWLSNKNLSWNYYGELTLKSAKLSGDLTLESSNSQIRVGQTDKAYIVLTSNYYGDGSIQLRDADGVVAIQLTYDNDSGGGPSFWLRDDTVRAVIDKLSIRHNEEVYIDSEQIIFDTRINSRGLHVSKDNYTTPRKSVNVGMGIDDNNRINFFAKGGNWTESAWPEYSYVLDPSQLDKGSVQAMSLDSLRYLFFSPSGFSDRLSKLSVLIIRNNSTY